MNNFLTNRILIIVMLLISAYSLQTINAQGPNAPEAASFEPVDATDMVNLMTGDFTYVLPLLNVPSPEGGYPIALSYHGGIAMDQEASWVGLGWNINPGAINRNINGYPDDYIEASIDEYYYDKGGVQTLNSLSLGYSNGGSSVGLGFSWGSNQSLSGSVSIGFGPSLLNVRASADSRGNSSVGLGTKLPGGLSLGANVNSNGTFGGSVGLSSNSSGFKIGVNSAGGYSFSVSSTSGNGSLLQLDVSLSSSGVGVSPAVNRAGVGLNLAHSTSINMGDYVTNSSGFTIPIFIPTPAGIFSLSYGRQKYEYYLSKNETIEVEGPLYFDEIITAEVGKLMDIYDFSTNDGSFESHTQAFRNNIAFPSFDSFQVQAQGLSGSMKINIPENGRLHGLSDKLNSDEDLIISYFSNRNTAPASRFDSDPYFYFDNEISSYFEIEETTYNSNVNNLNIGDHFQSGPVGINQRRKTSNYIEYFTNEDILQDYLTVKSKGYLIPEVNGFDRSSKPEKGIGGFQITAADGKIYHYSLPVYNHEIVTRKFGSNADNPNENQSYLEKRQLEAYATHWLLTAVTGPDYVDINNNGKADLGDYGYWTSFNYGKWSDAYVWKNPYGKEYIEADDDATTSNNSKSWIKGRKELYYLDMVRTRTHTALFVKKTREDARSIPWNYSSVDHIDDIQQNESDYVSRFNIPSHKSLGLEKIILLANDNQIVTKESGSGLPTTEIIEYNDSGKPAETAYYNLYDNVIDWGDNWASVINDAIKVIDFDKDYSLVNGAPNSPLGRLTLNKVVFKGKSGTHTIPSYTFNYNNSSYNFDIEDQDQYGYYDGDNSLWSLNEILSPQGSTINITYEPKKFKAALKPTLNFENGPTVGLNNSFVSSIEGNIGSEIFTIESSEDYGLKVGDDWLTINYIGVDCNGDYISEETYEGTGTIIENISDGTTFKFRVQGTGNFNNSSSPSNCGDGQFTGYEYLSINYKVLNEIEAGGILVSNIAVSDGLSSFSTDYTYGSDGDNIGVVSYIPFAPDVVEEVPYSMELPSPRVMYEIVNVSQLDKNNQPYARTEYVFNTFDSKDESELKFGDFFEIESAGTEFINNQNKNVSIKTHTVKDNLSSIGQLMSVTNFNQYNQILSSTKNVYYNPDNLPGQMGVIKESYQMYKSVDFKVNDFNPAHPTKDRWILGSSNRIKYPSSIKETILSNSSGVFRTAFNAVDLISGEALETSTVNSEGKTITTKSIPSFRIPGYGLMGTKVLNNRKNMLTQEAASLTYLIDESNYQNLLNASITTWSNNWSYRDFDGNENSPSELNEKIWRKKATYSWQGAINEDGAYSNYSGDFDGFNWNSTNQSENWQKLTETTRYDHFSSVLETQDINGNHASSKKDYNSEKILSTSNAAYTEQFYSGAERGVSGISGGEIDLEDPVSLFAHTGTFSERATSGSFCFNSTLTPVFNDAQLDSNSPSKDYKISVWVHISNYQNARINIENSIENFNGENVFAGDWVMLNHYIFDVAETIQISLTAQSGTVYFDDFRLHPVQSSMISYVYNQWGEVTFILGSNNMATKYEYDEAGNLSKTYAEFEDTSNLTGGFKLSSEFAKRYKRDITQ